MITANIFFNRIRGPYQPKIGSWESYRQLVLIPELAAKELAEQGYDEENPPLPAYVNHGHWRVKCECGSTEFAWEEGWFLCRACLNGAHKHKYRRSFFPKNRKKIEELLAKRPLPNRNWYPGEALTQLKKENKDHEEEMLEWPG